MKLTSRSHRVNFHGRITAAMIAWRWPLAMIAVVILAIALPLSWRLEMDRTIDQMFAADDPTLLAYNELRDAFGGNAAMMLVYHDPELMTPAGLDRAAGLSARVAKVPGVRGVLSVAQLNDLLGSFRPGGLLTGLSSDTPPLLRKEDFVSRAFERLFVGYTHSEDGFESAIVTLLEPADSKAGHHDVVAAMREIVSRMPIGTSNAVLVGEPVLLSEGFDLIEQDGFRLAVWTLALLSPLVLLLLRRLRWVVLQAVVIAWAVTVTRATLYVFDIRLSLVSSILTAICTVIAVTSVIHLGSTWQKRRLRGDDLSEASKLAIVTVMPAIFWACATDAAGFISLIGSAITPIREFAVMMAVASIAVWVAMMLFSPLVTTLAEHDRLRLESRLLSKAEYSIRRASVRFAATMLRYRGWVLIATLLLSLATLAGLNRLRIETSFLKNFRDDSEISLAYNRVEGSLRGAGVWDVVLDAPDELTDDYLNCVRDLEKRLREIEIDGERLTKVLSLADADRIVSAISLFRVVSPKVRLAGMRTAVPAFSDALLVQTGESNRKLRIMLRSREHLSTETKMSLIARVEQVVEAETTTPRWRESFGAGAGPRAGRVTGYYVMIARLVSQIIGDQWRCLAWAAALVWLLLVAATWSIRLATVALVPNLLPVLGVLGVLGWFGGEMNMGAAMIAAVSVGLSIDGSIHYLATYQQKIARGRTDEEAAIFAQRGVGLPIVLSTLALVIGFLGLGRSEFVPTATFGILTAAALLVGTIVNLALLPIVVCLSLPTAIFSGLHGNWIHLRRVRVLAERIAAMLPPGANVLDVGCGDGRLASRIMNLRPDVKITGTDVMMRGETAIEVVPFDGDRLPFPTASFAVCLLVDVLHHAENQDLLMSEVYRVSSQYVIVKDHHCQGFAARQTLEFMDKVGNQRHGVAIPGNYLTPQQWDSLIDRHGLEIDQRIEKIGLYQAPLNLFFERRLHFLDRLRKST
jgi:predicted RND superfamily exporter protein/SAM-dependent methyltransferase